MISGFKTVTEHPSEEFYIYPDATLTFTDIAGVSHLTSSDMGRTFTVSMRIYDTASRYVSVRFSNATLMEKSVVDYHRQMRNILTKSGEWIDVKVDYTVYELMYKGFDSISKNATLIAYGFGTEDKPIYVSDVKSVEKLSSVQLGDNIYIVNEEEPSDAFPSGQCDIICKKSPWVK